MKRGKFKSLNQVSKTSGGAKTKLYMRATRNKRSNCLPPARIATTTTAAAVRVGARAVAASATTTTVTTSTTTTAASATATTTSTAVHGHLLKLRGAGTDVSNGSQISRQCSHVSLGLPQNLDEFTSRFGVVHSEVSVRSTLSTSTTSSADSVNVIFTVVGEVTIRLSAKSNRKIKKGWIH